MVTGKKIRKLLLDAAEGRPINKKEAITLLNLPENSAESAMLRSVANIVSREKFANRGLLLGQIGVDMAPCGGDCAFCFFANSHTSIQPSVLEKEDIISRCNQFALGGVQGVFLMTMHRFGFDWFRDLCAGLRKAIPGHLEILANVGDVSSSQLKELHAAGVTGAYHVSRLREGVDSCMSPKSRRATIERILDAGLAWFNMCEPVGPEHTAEELAEQIWIGIDLPCTQHGVMQRFSVPGSPLFKHGQISLPRLSQIAAVIALATMDRKNVKSIAINVSNIVGLFSGANAFFPEAGEPSETEKKENQENTKEGFTTALWRQSNEITTADCRNMLISAGFSHLMDSRGKSKLPLKKMSYSEGDWGR